jgi:thiamine biosynthesis lipoprotein
MTIRLLSIFVICGLLSAAASGAELVRMEADQDHMGARFRLVIYADSQERGRAAITAAFARIKQLDNMLSDYDDASELSRLSRSAPAKKPVKVSDDLWRVLSFSQSISRHSDGAFDVTVGPYVKLWRRARRRKEMVKPERLVTARHSVGYQHVRLDEANRTVRLLRPAMRLDLGAVAKGYAADKALSVLQRHGCGRALIDAGGDVVLGDPPPGKTGWRIGIASHDDKLGKPTRHLVLARVAIATSGDSQQFVTLDGVRYSHIIDPRTGLGLTDHSRVTVIAKTGMSADALASAVSVLGSKKGLALVESECGAAVLILRLEGETMRTYESKRFGRLVESR